MILIAEIKTSEGQALALIQLPAKAFKTGSRGFYGNCKLLVGGKRYQTQVQLVEIGSKLASLAEAAPVAKKTQKAARKGAGTG